jgi:hypothetical protein
VCLIQTVFYFIHSVVSIALSDVVPLRNRGTWQGNSFFFSLRRPSRAKRFPSKVSSTLRLQLDPLWAHLWGGFCLTASAGDGFCVPFFLYIPLLLSTFYRAFLIQVPATIIAIISVSRALNLPKHEEPALKEKLQRIDFAGAAALICMTFALLVGLDRGSNLSWNDPYTIASLIVSLAFLLLLALIEVHWAKEPFAPRRVIANSSLIASYLSNFFGYGATSALPFEVSLYYQAVLRKTSFEAGLFFLPGIVACVIGSLIWGLIVQITGKYYVITVAAYAILFFGNLGVCALTDKVSSPIIVLIIGMSLFSLKKNMRISVNDGSPS